MDLGPSCAHDLQVNELGTLVQPCHLTLLQYFNPLTWVSHFATALKRAKHGLDNAAQTMLFGDPKHVGYARLAWSRFSKNRAAYYSFLTLATMLGSMILLVNLHYIVGQEYHPRYQTLVPGSADKPISFRHPLGQMANGADWLITLCSAGLATFRDAALACIITVSIGLVLGMVSAYCGGFLDALILRIGDFVDSLPTYLLFLLILTQLESNRGIATSILFGLLYWPSTNLLVRGNTLNIQTKEFVEAARISGASEWSILFSHILPNLLGTLSLKAANLMTTYFRVEAGIVYLGCGPCPPEDNFGQHLANFSTSGFFWEFRHLVIVTLFSAVVFMITFIGNGIRDAVDVKAH